MAPQNQMMRRMRPRTPGTMADGSPAPMGGGMPPSPPVTPGTMADGSPAPMGGEAPMPPTGGPPGVPPQGPPPVDVRGQAAQLTREALLRRMGAGPMAAGSGGPPPGMMGGGGMDMETDQMGRPQAQGVPGQPTDVRAILGQLLSSRNSRRVLSRGPAIDGQ